MDRGSFNGPGGPHSRWVVPATQGASMPAGLMLRNRIINGFIANDQVLPPQPRRPGPVRPGGGRRHRARRGARSPARSAGIVVRLDGAAPHDRTPPDDPATNALSPGRPLYNFYTLEVVQRIGYDSLLPGQRRASSPKTRTAKAPNGGPNGFNCFNWVIDAHPEDINMVDFKRPNGAAGHAHRRRLPPAERRPLPRRPELRQSIRI